MFCLHMDSSQEQSRASCLGWGCWGLPGFFSVAHAFTFNLCLLQNHDVGCFQHGGLLNSTSTEALHPVTLLSWTFLCITGYRQSPWCLHQMPVMHTQLWPIPSDSTYHPVGVRIIGVIQHLCLAVVSFASSRTNFSRDLAPLLKNWGPSLGYAALSMLLVSTELMGMSPSGLKPPNTVQVWPLHAVLVSLCSLFLNIGKQGGSLHIPRHI